MDKTQTGVGKYLLGKGGALDLDEAAAALEHVGSSLQAFLADAEPKTLTRTERLARALVTRPELSDLVEDLLPVPQKKLADVIELARGLGHVATPRRATRTPESSGAPPRGRRTKSAPGRRR